MSNRQTKTMEELATVLKGNKLDASSLRLFADAGSGEIYCLIVPGEEAIPLWQTLRGLLNETSYWPVLLGDKENAETHIAVINPTKEHMPFSDKRSTGKIIAEGLRIDTDQWLQAGWAEEFAYDEDYTEEDLHGDRPTYMPPDDIFTIPLDRDLGSDYQRSGRWLHEVYVALVPTILPWKVPAFPRFGRWNSCPSPDLHVAMLKRWYDTHGAEVVGISRDTMELQVARPPTDRTTALALAKEQYIYCEDVVNQGVGTLENLAVILLGGPVWQFWWD